jgi:PHP family Zn ribbon phosphoesterase
LIPLAEIIGLALHKSTTSKAVNTVWESLLAGFGTEVNVLVDAPMDDFRTNTANFNLDARVIEAIKAFREGKVSVKPGGGGKYGVIELKTKGSEEGREKDEGIAVEGDTERGQKRQLSLCDF